MKKKKFFFLNVYCAIYTAQFLYHIIWSKTQLLQLATKSFEDKMCGISMSDIAHLLIYSSKACIAIY